LPKLLILQEFFKLVFGFVLPYNGYIDW